MKIEDLITESPLFEQANFHTLRDDSVVTVFHGTSDLKHAANFVMNGIDGRQPIHRLYPHTIGNSRGEAEIVNRGVFVAPDLKTAHSFGAYTIKFRTLAKNLFSIFPSPEKMRKDRELWQERFPNSFRPELSAYLSGAAWSTEPQALFRGTVSPRAIEAVYVRSLTSNDYQRMSPEEFLTYYKEQTQGSYDTVRKNMAEPQERTTMDLDTFYDRVGQRYRGMMSREKLKDALRKGLERDEYYEQQIETIRDIGFPYSVAQRILPVLLRDLGIDKKPVFGQKSIYHGM